MREPKTNPAYRVVYGTYRFIEGPANRYGYRPPVLHHETRVMLFQYTEQATSFFERLKEKKADSDGAKLLSAHLEQLIPTLTGMRWNRTRTTENIEK